MYRLYFVHSVNYNKYTFFFIYIEGKEGCINVIVVIIIGP